MYIFDSFIFIVKLCCTRIIQTNFKFKMQLFKKYYGNFVNNVTTMKEI